MRRVALEKEQRYREKLLQSSLNRSKQIQPAKPDSTDSQPKKRPTSAPPRRPPSAPQIQPNPKVAPKPKKASVTYDKTGGNLSNKFNLLLTTDVENES